MTYSGGVTQRLLDIDQFKRRINRNDPVANIYRNAIDLNRYSNAVANQVVTAYNDVILSAVDDLRRIDMGVATAGGGIVSPASYQAQRLRVILAQLRESLDTWAGSSTALVSGELQGLAELQTQFITDQMRLAIRGGIADARELLPSQVDALQMVQTVQVAPNFAATVVSVDPTAINFTLPGTGAFNLTAGQGAAITLPNGQIVEKAFRGLAESQAQMFNTVVRNGVLTGEPTPQIARRLVGNLDFGQQAMSVRQRALAGGEVTKMANNQVLTIVRTSVQDVSNQASQQVYRANPDITGKYRYVATLDGRTSAICRSLDGREFKYGDGPTPPVHFNCLPGDALITPGGRIAAVYRRPYQGSLYVIKTSNGHMLRVTPNHPVLTSTGWQPAQSINVGDQIFSCSIIPEKTAGNHQESNAVATAEDVFRAFRESLSVVTMEVPTTAPDFHGDAWSGGPRINLAEQVAVVLADRELLLTVNPGLLESLHNSTFHGANFATASGSHLDQGLFAVGLPALSSMSGGSQSFAFNSGNATHASKLLLAPVAQLATGFQDDALYGTWRDAEAICDAANADALIKQGYDQSDVCWIGWEPFSGHVYNFETESGTYCADSILTHNCRSTTIPIIDYKALGIPPPDWGTGPSKRASADGPVSGSVVVDGKRVVNSYGYWLKDQPQAYREEVLGKTRAAYFDKLAEKTNPQKALVQLVREDGSEVTLKELQRKYEKP